MLKRLLWCSLSLVICSFNSHAAPNPNGKVPPIEYVQARIWRNMKLADFSLEGVLRTEKNKYPISLRTKGYEMVYEFKDQPLQIRVVIDPENSTVERRANGNDAWQPVTPVERTKTILDSDVTYEDLCMDFIRWENVAPVGTDSIKTLGAWTFDAKPSGVSRYARARYWISSDYGAFLRVDAFNKKNQCVKRVEVNGVQKIGESYVIKEMMISNLIPGRDISASRSYVEIRSGKPGESGIQ